MSKLKAIIPTAILFAAPWMHKIIYMNIMAAGIGTSSEDAHIYGIMGAFFAGLFTWIMLERSSS